MNHTDTSRPIGVFDSGIGGLTAMKELLAILPGEDILYFGDTARVPYGSHSPETIIEFAQQDLSFLLSQDVKAVLVACGTVSATALGTLRTMTDLPVIGVIEAAARKAAAVSRNKKVLVLATQASVNSRAYERAIAAIDPSVQVLGQACPLFVPLIENGYADCSNPVTRMVVRDYLEPVKDFGADTVILGCTHYPLLRDAIGDFLPEATLVEAGKEAAIELKEQLSAAGALCSDSRRGSRRYAVSEQTSSFSQVCELFLGEKISETIETVRFN